MKWTDKDVKRLEEENENLSCKIYDFHPVVAEIYADLGGDGIHCHNQAVMLSHDGKKIWRPDTPGWANSMDDVVNFNVGLNIDFDELIEEEFSWDWPDSDYKHELERKMYFLFDIAVCKKIQEFIDECKSKNLPIKYGGETYK